MMKTQIIMMERCMKIQANLKSKKKMMKMTQKAVKKKSLRSEEM